MDLVGLQNKPKLMETITLRTKNHRQSLVQSKKGGKTNTLGPT